MKVKYYFEYEIDNRHQAPENGTIEIDKRELQIIQTACKCRNITIKDLLEHFVKTLTIEKAEAIILSMKL